MKAEIVAVTVCIDSTDEVEVDIRDGAVYPADRDERCDAWIARQAAAEAAVRAFRGEGLRERVEALARDLAAEASGCDAAAEASTTAQIRAGWEAAAEMKRQAGARIRFVLSAPATEEVPR